MSVCVVWALRRQGSEDALESIGGAEEFRDRFLVELILRVVMLVGLGEGHRCRCRGRIRMC